MLCYFLMVCFTITFWFFSSLVRFNFCETNTYRKRKVKLGTIIHNFTVQQMAVVAPLGRKQATMWIYIQIIVKNFQGLYRTTTESYIIRDQQYKRLAK